MRIRKEYKKSGYFWLPSNVEKKLPGTLSITDGGNSELEVVVLFNEGIEALNSDPHLGRIIGHVEEDGLVTLEECVYRRRNFSFGGISKSPIKVGMVLSGIAYEKDEKVTFNTLSFSVEGIDIWFGMSGITKNFFENEAVAINYRPPEKTSFTLKNGMLLIIDVSLTLSESPNTIEVGLSQKTYFKLVSNEKKELEEFTEVAYKMTNLLCFAIDKTVCLEHVSATSTEIYMDMEEGKTRPIQIRIYYRSLPFVESTPTIDSSTMLFRFSQIRGDAGKIITSWLNAYDKISPALGLYFSTKTGAQRFVDGRFLALAQGLETYHRRTSNEKLMDNTKFEDLVSHLLSECPAENRDWLEDRLIQ